MVPAPRAFAEPNRAALRRVMVYLAIPLPSYSPSLTPSLSRTGSAFCPYCPVGGLPGTNSLLGQDLRRDLLHGVMSSSWGLPSTAHHWPFINPTTSTGKGPLWLHFAINCVPWDVLAPQPSAGGGPALPPVDAAPVTPTLARSSS